jgi:hypothetical protein
VRFHRLRHLVGRCDAVGQHVMDLVDDRDAVIATPSATYISHGDGPDRRCAGDLADQLIELPTRGGAVLWR